MAFTHSPRKDGWDREKNETFLLVYVVGWKKMNKWKNWKKQKRILQWNYVITVAIATSSSYWKKKNLLRQLSFRPETCFVFVFLSFRISFLTKTENKVGVKILRNGLMRLGEKMAVFPAFFKFCGPISNFTISQFLPLQFFY